VRHSPKLPNMADTDGRRIRNLIEKLLAAEKARAGLGIRLNDAERDREIAEKERDELAKALRELLELQSPGEHRSGAPIFWREMEEEACEQARSVLARLNAQC
jgi:L-lactate utilization protein LutB